MYFIDLLSHLRTKKNYLATRPVKCMLKKSKKNCKVVFEVSAFLDDPDPDLLSFTGLQKHVLNNQFICM